MTTQEVIALMLEIRNGNVPDVVVFYNGVNDVFSAYQQRTPGLPQNEGNRRREFGMRRLGTAGNVGIVDILRRDSAAVRAVTNLGRKLFGPAEPGPSRQGTDLRSDSGDSAIASTDTLAKATVAAYVSNLGLVEALARQYGFVACFFWQPTVFMKAPRSDREESMRRLVDREFAGFEEFYWRVNREIAQLKAPPDGFYDLRGVFDDHKEPLFIDWMHATEEGNAIAADAILRVLLRRCAFLSDASR